MDLETRVKRIEEKLGIKDEKKEPLVLWVNQYSGPTFGVWTSKEECLRARQAVAERNGVRLVECPEGSVVVSRERLADAFDASVYEVYRGAEANNSVAFERLCRALGLKENG